MKFTDYPFPGSLQRDIAAAGYETPTPIQVQCIPPALAGKDLIGLAQTGTGKTAAFALPIICRLAGRMELGALVLAPTRELAAQIVSVFRVLGRSTGLRVASLVGGVKMDLDYAALKSWPNVLVATPGRLIDHLEQKTVTLKEIEVLTVDEADRMHDMGFIPQIRRIIAHLPENRQTMMFTATMPADVEQIARRHMRDPLRIQVGPASAPVERAEQRLYQVQEAEKTPLLLNLLSKERGRVLVFVRTKRGVDRLARRVLGKGHRVARLHGDREQNQRDEAMKGFRDGRYHILLATDIAARGLDVADIEHVINYDFPRSPGDYVHRIGRTARLEASGRATSFVTPADRAYVRALEQLLGKKLNLAAATAAKPSTHAPEAHQVGHGAHGLRHAARAPRPGASPPRQAADASVHAPTTPKRETYDGGAGGGPQPSARPSRRRRRRRGRGKHGPSGAPAAAVQGAGTVVPARHQAADPAARHHAPGHPARVGAANPPGADRAGHPAPSLPARHTTPAVVKPVPADMPHEPTVIEWD
jgi:ATP-dependent RNA helicase RhlE